MNKEFKNYLSKYEVKDWKNPLHYYDYEAAFKDKARPEKNEEGIWKWPSKYKHPLHPDRYVYENEELIDSITGNPATKEEKLVYDLARKWTLPKTAFK